MATIKYKKPKGFDAKKITTLNINNSSTKFGNKWCIIDGIKFQSIKEGSYYLFLKGQKLTGKIHDYKRQVPFSLSVNGVHVCKYIADFVLTNNDGSKIVIDVKGFKTDVYKLKKSLMFAVHAIKIVEK